jgi:DNA polymerase-3 subunit epsilon
MNVNAPIREHTFAAIDFESAGVSSGRTDVPIQLGMVHWRPEAGLGAQYVSYLRSEQKITWSAQKIHGITVADLADAPDLLVLWPQVKEHLSDRVIVAHGKGTEKKFLRAYPGHGFGPWVDTLLLARATWPQWHDHSLGSLCDALDLTRLIQEACPHRCWHDALFDAIASIFLLEKIIDLTHAWSAPLDHLLQPDQKEWHKHQSARR